MRDLRVSLALPENREARSRTASGRQTKLNSSAKKLRGRFWRPRSSCCDRPISVSSCWPSSLSFWLPWLPILPSIVHGSRNDELLRLSECIESLKSEVKQKMMNGGERNRGTKVTATKFPVSEFEASRKLRDCFFFSRLFSNQRK